MGLLKKARPWNRRWKTRGMPLRLEDCRLLQKLVVADVGKLLPYGGATSTMFLDRVAGVDEHVSSSALGRWLASSAASYYGVVVCKTHEGKKYYKTDPSHARGLLKSFMTVEAVEELTAPRRPPQEAAERSESSATRPSAPATTSSTSSLGATRTHEDAIPAGGTPAGRGNRSPDDTIIATSQGAGGSSSSNHNPARRLFRFVSSSKHLRIKRGCFEDAPLWSDSKYHNMFKEGTWPWCRDSQIRKLHCFRI
jgi:hypothetical protein